MDEFLNFLTKEEFDYFFGSQDSLEWDRKAFDESADLKNSYFANLYHRRGNQKKCEEYLAAIKDEQYRMDTQLLIFEVVE